MPQVSIIVLTYNPDAAKLRQTLTAAAAQQDVDFEIIISDDGSARKDFSFLPDFMDSLGMKQYQLLDHKENRGTVQNCLRAVKAASGEYVFLTSPGDYLFDDYVLRDFYRFAKKNDVPVCFGNAVFYNTEGGTPNTTRTFGCPACPQLYAPNASAAQVNTCFFGGTWIIGASYFRLRSLTLACLEEIADTSVYMEDTPSTAFALAAGEHLCYYDRNVVWYEDGTGVSTGGNEKWDRLLRQDILHSFTKLKDRYPKNPYVDIAYRNISQTNRVKRIAGNFVQHPKIMARLAILRKTKKKAIICTQTDLQRLSALLENK